MSQHRTNSSPDLDLPASPKDQRYDDLALQGAVSCCIVSLALSLFPSPPFSHVVSNLVWIRDLH